MTERNDSDYRKCVGIMLMRFDGKIWVGTRKDSSMISKTKKYRQMPQGGIDEGESPIFAARREAFEETGLQNLALAGIYPEWLYYDLPKELIANFWQGRYKGQRQLWFAFQFLGGDEEFDLEGPHAEFTHGDWVSPQELPDLAVPFKKDIYRKLVAHFCA